MAEAATTGTHPAHSLRYVVRQAGWAGVTDVVGLVLRYGLAILIARLHGPLGLGLYALAMALANGAAVVARLGLDQAMLRFIPHHRARQEPGKVVGVLLFATLLVGMLGTTVALVLFLGAPYLAETWGRPEFGRAGRLIALTIPLMALGQVWRAGLRGFQDVRLAVILERVVIPIATISGLLLIFLVRPNEPLAAVAGVTFSYWLVGLVSLAILVKKIRTIAAPPAYQMGAWMKFALPMSLEGGLLFLVFWTDQLMIGWLLDASHVGVYTSAIRVAGLVVLPLVAINTIFAPTAASLHARGDRTTLQALYARLTWSTAMVGGCIALSLLVGGRWVLGIFGSPFVAGHLALMILVVGQAVNSATGSSGTILAMTGNPKWRLANATIAAGLNVVLNLLLVPRWGIAGAATATAASISLISLLQLLEVRWLVGLWAYDRRGLVLKRGSQNRTAA